MPIRPVKPARCMICHNMPSEYISGKWSWFKCDHCNVMSMPCDNSPDAVDVWNSYNLMQDVMEGLNAACDNTLDITKL